MQFFTERAISRQSEPGMIAIAPSSDSWNNFGERMLAEIAIQPRSETPFSHEHLIFRSFFGFVDKQAGKSDTLHLRDIVDQTTDTPVPDDEVPDYFKMLPDMASYRRNVGDLGPQEARLAMHAINDIVEPDGQAVNRPCLRAAREPDVPQRLPATERAVFSWKNAAAILRGVDYKKLNRISDGLHIRFRLAGQPNDDGLACRFADSDAVVPQRLAIVIGKNAVGKARHWRRSSMPHSPASRS